MAVPEQTPYIEHTGNGVTTSFSLGFQCESKDHLIVLVDEIEPPIATWSLTGGNVVFTTAPAAGKKITLQRNTPFNRTAEYQSFNNSFRPQTVNIDFDRIWWKLQELGVADWILSNRISALKAYVDDRDDELRAYLMEEIRKQGVALDQLDEYYNYLMERLAQIAVDKGWDASFVTYQGITQEKINDGLGSILEMLSIQAPKNGMRVFVKGLQGGWFEYNASKASENDGGTVFDGWVRIHYLTENLAEWWGARWDGTDTTEALGNAIIESAKTGKTLYLGGSDRTYTINTMRHIVGWQGCAFIIQNNMHLRGEGCKVVVDNRFTTMPNEGHGWAFRVFTTNLLTNNVSIKGIDFDSQFDKYADTNHHVGFFVIAGIPVNHVRIQHCKFYNGSSANSVALYLDRFNTVIGKDWKVLDCQFINSGNGYDHSPVYLMVDDAEVKVDVLQRFDDPVKNLWCANAIEVHGSNQNIHHCLIDKVGGGIIAGINYASEIKNTNINNNIINTYSGGVTIWNGEDAYDKGHDDVLISGNTVHVIPYLTTGRRLGIGTGGFGNSAKNITITGNTIICEDAAGAVTAAYPIDIAFTTAGTGFAQVGTLNITNNTTRGAMGIAVSSALTNRVFRDLVVKDNTIMLDHAIPDLTNRGVLVSMPPAGSTLNNRSVVLKGNTVNTSVAGSTIAYYLSGFINQLTLDNTAQSGIQKYYIANEPDVYIDCENLVQPSNLNVYLKAQTDKQLVFAVNLAAMRVGATSNTLRLCTLPARSIVTGVRSLVVSGVSGATEPKVSVGVAGFPEYLLRNITLTTTPVGGLLNTQKGTAFDTSQAVYNGANTDIILNLSVFDTLANISGIVEITIDFEQM